MNKPMRVLAVDPGSRRIGLALSDEEGSIALPLETVERRGEAAAVRRIAEVVRERGAREIVVGLPLELDGTEGPAARRARLFAGAIEREVEVPVVLWDERLTTVSAERALRESGVRGAKRRRVVDQVAATVLLSGYLEARRARAGDGDADRWDGDEPEADVGRGRRER